MILKKEFDYKFDQSGIKNPNEMEIYDCASFAFNKNDMKKSLSGGGS